ncbi:MAG: ABC transporter ATP-binding protein [Variovorax sp.]
MQLEARGIVLRYGDNVVLNALSLSLDTSRLTGLIGPNGAGKSTLFSVLSGFMKAQAGEVFYLGRPLRRMPPEQRARLGLMRTFQVPREFRHLTVLDNMLAAPWDQPGESLAALLLRRARVQRMERENTERAHEWLRFLRLDHVAATPAGQLSGGQKKLLELGRILMLEPRCVLLDEPYAGVNPVLIEQISERIRELHARGIGFVIVEHNLHALSRLVERMLVLDGGRLLAEGSPDEVLADPRVQAAYMGA